MSADSRTSGSAWMRAALVGGVGVVVGCFEDAPTIDTTTTTMTSTATTSAEVSTGDGPSTDSAGTGTSTGATQTSSTTADMVDTSGDASTSTSCEGDPTAIAWADDAIVVLPMELVMAIFLPGEPAMARSYAADMGTITFEFELPCPTTLYVHALVWDVTGGALPENADSFHVSVDGGSEWVWAYGCATQGMGDGVWAWLPINEWTEVDCDATPVTLELPAGVHEIRLRNREAGAGNDFAAVAAMVVSDDPSFDPTSLYDPNP